MVGDGVEVIIGVNCDPQLGPVLLFGSGGVMVEVYNDVALRRCPITRSEAQAMIVEVKGARLLQGFRGRPAADLAALADTLVRVSSLATHLEGHLAELDINPLMVLPSRSGGEGGRRPRRVSRHITLHVAESRTQKFAEPNRRQQRTAFEPTTAAHPWRREPLLMPLIGPLLPTPRNGEVGWKAPIRTRFLRDLSDCSDNSGTAV